MFRCSAADLDRLHEEAAELRTSVQALMEHRLLGRPLQTERERRRKASQDQLPMRGLDLTG